MVSIKPFVDDEMLRRPHIEPWRPRYNDASWRHITDTDIGRRLRVPWFMLREIKIHAVLFTFFGVAV